MLDESQTGFYKRYSTIDNLFSLHAIIPKYLCSPRGRFFFIFIDFRGAFDLFVLMFADDVSCFSDTVVRLQRLINLIEKFCNAVGMKLNLDKTKIMVFRNGGIVKHVEKWFFQGTEIEIVWLYKYLGLYFTPKLIWTKTKEILSMQAKKAATSIFRYLKYFGRFQPNDAFKLFDSMVKPVACYGAEIWGYQFCEEIEKVQSRF